MKDFAGDVAPDHWYHAGHPVNEDVARERAAHGLPVYRPTDPRAIDQRPYIAFAKKDTTPIYQKEDA